MEWDLKRIPRSKKSKKLPYVLDDIEINALFDAVTNIKHKAILMTIYGGGLRVSEATHLKVINIDSKTMQIRIDQAKGKKDRYTILSEINLRILRDYWKIYRIKESSNHSLCFTDREDVVLHYLNFRYTPKSYRKDETKTRASCGN